jgi:hypothetical protein
LIVFATITRIATHAIAADIRAAIVVSNWTTFATSTRLTDVALARETLIVFTPLIRVAAHTVTADTRAAIVTLDRKTVATSTRLADVALESSSRLTDTLFAIVILGAGVAIGVATRAIRERFLDALTIVGITLTGIAGVSFADLGCSLAPPSRGAAVIDRTRIAVVT